MTTWKDLFGSEICSCGKQGEYIISSCGKVIGFHCRTCYLEDKRQKDAAKILQLGSDFAKPAKWIH